MCRKDTGAHACAHAHTHAGLCGPRAQASPGRYRESWRIQRLQHKAEGALLRHPRAALPPPSSAGNLLPSPC